MDPDFKTLEEAFDEYLREIEPKCQSCGHGRDRHRADGVVGKCRDCDCALYVARLADFDTRGE